MDRKQDEQMIEALRDGVHGLHLARMALVGEARALRLAGRRAERDKVWARVEEITAQIEVSTKDLAEHMLRADQTQRRGDAETRAAGTMDRADRTEAAGQYYFRWVGFLGDAPYISAMMGPYLSPAELKVGGDGVTVLDWYTRIEIEREREHLEQRVGCDRLHLEMSEVSGGECREWRLSACASHVSGQEAEMPLLRDPAAEMPDDEADVVVVLLANDEGRGVTTGAHHAGHGWCETQDGQARGLIIRSDMIEGWCHHHEAAEALRKAVRHG